MLTRDRPRLAKRAIRCYRLQRYPRRELVIVCQGSAEYRRELRHQVDTEQIPNVRFVAADPALRLGALRNISLAAAHGDLICVWDDDDLSHPDRLVHQVDHLLRTGADATFLSAHLQFFEQRRMLYWVDRRRSVRPEQHRLLPGTMLMRRDPRFRYPETGRYAHFGEDWQLMLDLRREGEVVTLDGKGLLYLYAYHGDNTFSEDHHRRLTRDSLPCEWILAHADELRQVLEHYPIPRPLTVHGVEGTAFTVD